MSHMVMGKRRRALQARVHPSQRHLRGKDGAEKPALMVVVRHWSGELEEGTGTGPQGKA